MVAELFPPFSDRGPLTCYVLSSACPVTNLFLEVFLWLIQVLAMAQGSATLVFPVGVGQSSSPAPTSPV